MSAKIILSNIANYSKGRGGHAITMGIFHRTAITGDTALSEANYSHNNVVKASYYKVIDLDGNIIESVLLQDTEWAADNYPINQVSLNYEFTGLNGSPLTHAQIIAVIADIKADPAAKRIANHILTTQEIVRVDVSGWCSHHDITNAFHIYGGHVDAISSSELAQILAGIYAVTPAVGGGKGPAAK
jgi:N-acetylmuramoyl-L-alanine amidase